MTPPQKQFFAQKIIFLHRKTRQPEWNLGGGKKPWGSSGKGDQVKETTPVINFLAQRLKGEVKTFMWKLNSLLGSRGLGLHRWCRATPELSKVLQHLSSSVTETLWGTISFQMWWLTLWEVLSFICKILPFYGERSHCRWQEKVWS